MIVLSAILYPMYHIFDILDGKHARKTSQSSPLGLLVDHGCDALTTFLFTMGLGSIMKLDGAFWYALIWLMTSIPFFLCTWEEYHTDRLDFPCIHGVSEGTFIASGVMFFTAIIGQEFWLTDVFLFGSYHKLNNVLLTGFTIASLLFGLTSVYKVVRHEKTISTLNAFGNTLVFFFMIMSMMIVIFYSGCSYVELYPKLIIYMFGFTFSKLVGHLQVVHLANAPFDQFSLPIMFFLFSIGLIPLVQFYLDTFVNMDYVILFFLVFNFLAWIHYAYFVSKELCEFLQIKMFLPKSKITVTDLQQVAIK